MSRAAFCARFASLVGEPPMAYLIGWRMTLAADKLRDTDATVAAVAREVGYDNAFSFSTAFKLDGTARVAIAVATAARTIACAADPPWPCPVLA